MKYRDSYSIGEVSKLCNVSKKALRYYDKIGLINSERDDINNYRYYSNASLLAVPVIKYYKQMGFTLNEMREYIEGTACKVLKRSFNSKIEELKKTQDKTRRMYISVKDWHDLILEAEMIIDNKIHEVSIKYVDPSEFLYQEQEFDNNIMAAIINIEFTNYVEKADNEITGPVMIKFSSFKDRIQNEKQKIWIMQKTLKKCQENEKMAFGGQIMISCYHIGAHESIYETYEKISDWARRQGYIPGEESYERYVTDYWTTRNSAQFVTEIMMNVSRQ